MKKLFLVALVLLVGNKVFCEPAPKEAVPQFENSSQPQKQENSSHVHNKKSRFKSPRKIFPPSEKDKSHPAAPKSLDDQIKDADQSDLEQD